MDEVSDILLAAWEKRIRDLMVEGTAASVEFLAGDDFQISEVDWITRRLIPHIQTGGRATAFACFSPCDCYGRTCGDVGSHVKKLVVTLL